MPERIAALEQEQIQLRDEAAAPEFYKSPKDRITTVLARIDAVQKELDAVLERWVELDAIDSAIRLAMSRLGDRRVAVPATRPE